MASLYVATSPGRPADGNPAALAAASTSPAVAQTDEPAEEMGVTAGAIGATVVELEEEFDPVLTEAEPAESEAQKPEPEAQEAEPEPVAEPVAQEPEPPAEPIAEPEPEPIVEPAAEPAIEPTVEEPEPIAEPEPEPAAPEQQDSAVWRNGWVCDGELRLEDELLRDWTITRASFLPGNGHERVVLHLDRVGAGSGEVASLTAEAFPRLEVEGEVPGVRQPSLGRTAIALQFSDGVKTDFSLRGYRPSGLVTVREFSAYPAGSSASRVIISTTTDDGCFKVRVPAWTSGANAQKGQIYIDIKS